MNVLSREMKITDLNEYLLKMVTNYLPDEDKFKLTAIFPFFWQQIEVFDIKYVNCDHRNCDQDKNFGIKLVTKLTNVRKVKLLPRYVSGQDNICKKLLRIKNAFISGINPNIKWFEDLDSDDVYQYVENCCKRYPDYDANHLEYHFFSRYSESKILELIGKYPKLNLKLFYSSPSGSRWSTSAVCHPYPDNETLNIMTSSAFKNINLNDLIDDMSPDITKSYVIEFDSPGDKQLYDRFINISTLTLSLTYGADPNLGPYSDDMLNTCDIKAQILLKYILSFQNLELLSIKFVECSRYERYGPSKDPQRLNVAHRVYDSLIRSLLTLNGSGIKKLCLYSDYNYSFNLDGITFNEGLKYVDMNMKNSYHIQCTDRHMKISFKNYPSDLFKSLFERFPKVRYVDIDEDMFKNTNIGNEIESIIQILDRNRNIHVKLIPATKYDEQDNQSDEEQDIEDNEPDGGEDIEDKESNVDVPKIGERRNKKKCSII